MSDDHSDENDTVAWLEYRASIEPNPITRMALSEGAAELAAEQNLADQLGEALEEHLLIGVPPEFGGTRDIKTAYFKGNVAYSRWRARRAPTQET